MHRYKCYSAPMSTTVAMAKQSSTTAIHTLLQLATPSTRQIELIAWGFELDGIPVGATASMELLQTDGAATVTAHAASGVQPQQPGIPASLLTLGTTATGYNATGEGAITATRTFDECLILPMAGTSPLDYSYQWMPDERPRVAASSFLRVRCTFPSIVNIISWVVWDE